MISFSDENKTLVEQLDELREQLNTIDKIYQTVDVTANDARDITEEGLRSIDEAEKVLDKIYEQLTVNKILFFLFTMTKSIEYFKNFFQNYMYNFILNDRKRKIT